MEDVVLITPPAAEPVTVDEFKSHCHVSSSRDDSYIRDIVIPGTRAVVESELKRALVTQTWLYRLDGFPGLDARYETTGYPTILIPKPPFQSIVSFTFIDTAGVVQTLLPCNADGTTQGGQFYGYQVDPGSETQPGRLLPPWARPWPPNRRMPMAVQIRFIAGYGGPVTDQNASPVTTAWGPNPIPPDLKLGILHVGAFLYDNRWGERDQDANKISRAISNLLSPWVNRIA